MTKKKRETLWEGPNGEGPNGGITQSMLSTFIVCRERFRVKYCEGWQEADTFRHRIEYGSMWHVCEEALASEQSKEHWLVWNDKLKEYAKKLCSRYRDQQPQVMHWMNVCKTQFPAYVNFWKTHPDAVTRKPLLQEKAFDVSYTLPSERTVRLRGKWDSVDIIGRGKDARVYLQENKTKGDVDEGQMRKQLMFDLQTMFYLIALEREGVDVSYPIAGVRYNVIRRPLAGGRNSIRKREPSKTNPRGESDDEFYSRLGGLIAEDPAYYFMRWCVEVLPSDLERFQQQCLDPWLEMLYDWWENERDEVPSPQTEGRVTHARTPYGIYNVIAEGGTSDVDQYLADGSTVGLAKAEKLFTELE